MRTTAVEPQRAVLPPAPHLSVPSPSTPTAIAPLHAAPRDDGARIAALAAHALAADGGLLSRSGECAEPSPYVANGETLAAHELQTLRRLAAQVANTVQPFVVPDLRALPQSSGQSSTCAYAAVPLIAPDGRSLGVLAVFQRAPRAWSAAEIAMLGDLARLAAADRARTEHGSSSVVREHARHLALLDVGAAGVVEIDSEGRCVLVNAAADGLLGYGNALDGRDVHLFLHTRWDGTPQHEFDRCPLTTVLRAGLRLGPEETVLQSSDGSRFYAEYAAAPIVEEGVVSGALLWFRDLTPRKQLEDRLAQQAQSDALTGLANRPAFADRLHEALARVAREGGAVAVLLLDVDDFSAVNQNYGNAAGDRLLIEVGRRLTTCVRHGDLVARSGGDEFAILLERVSGLAETRRVSERLLAGLRPPFPLAGGTVQTCASMGIAMVDGSCAADDLVRAAAAALLEAKRSNPGGAVIAETGAPLLD